MDKGLVKSIQSFNNQNQDLNSKAEGNYSCGRE